MNILEELYYGKINLENQFFEPTSQYNAAVKTSYSNEEKLNLSLDDNEKRLLSKLRNAQDEILATECCEYFIKGWRLGARFMLDTFIICK